MLKLAEYGIPVLIFRDPFSKKPSMPFSMMIVSITLVVCGIVGKLSHVVGGIDMPNAMQFLSTSAALYFGHTWVHKETKNGADTLEVKTGDTDQDK